MRRTLTTVVAVLAVAGSLLATPTVSAASAASAADPRSDLRSLTEAAARVTAARTALQRAEDLLAGRPAPAGLSPTMALRDLFLALPALTGDDRTQARGLLARPTQGSQDPNGDGYTVKARKDCGTKICLHWVPTTSDAPSSRRWVSTTADVMRRTWRREVDKLGFRRPVRDGHRGGNDKFDVYLADVGDQGYYGYCVPERTKPGHKWVASGYCVLDNDFARAQFGTKPMRALRVTAAHEFFHAVQYAHDYAEDRWLLESTATWMEERVADDVNDNRQYLDHGQVAEPQDPLDWYVEGGFSQYGNWVFFEYLSDRFGVDIVRTIWRRSAAYAGAPDQYSIAAVKSALPRSKSFADVFRSYAAGNTVPGRTYAEGGGWPSVAMVASHDLSPTDRRASGTLRIDHLASKNLVVRPAGLKDRAWTLRVKIDGPTRRTTPAAYVIVHKAGGTKIVRKPVRLDRAGDGVSTFRFDAGSVSRATVTLVNASTRYNCWEQDVTYSCQGVPKHDGRRFSYALRVFRR